MSASARIICIGTHHKTGTIWMRKVWRRIAAEQSIPFMQVYRAKRLADIAPEGPHILVNWSSSFPKEVFARPDTRLMHIIRDPRDVLLSGMRYHRIAPLGNEKFLRQARDDLGGRTYQEHLNALPDDLARLRFEMVEKHAETVKQMLAWPYGHPQATDIRYEDLIADTDCTQFRTMLEDWAIPDLDIDHAVQVFWDLSLFGGLKDSADRTTRTANHVASGRSRQWPSRLPREIAQDYAKQFGPALKQLGYAENDTWVSECTPQDQVAMC